MKITKSHIVFFTFFMLIMANCRFLIDKKISSYFEYFALGLLTLEILIFFFKQKNYKKKSDVILFIISNILFSIGIVMQHLPITSILRLVLTMVSLSTFMIFSRFYLNSYKYMRDAAYGMFFGVIANTLLCLITNTTVLEPIYDNILFIPLRYGFTGGMQMKNMLSTTALASFMGIIFYYRHEKKKKIDLFMLFILTILQLISISKGGLIFFVLFIILELFDKEKSKLFEKKFSLGLKVVITCMIFISIIIGGYFTYNNFLKKSYTYGFRIRGIENYIDMVKKDQFHLFFGYAEMAFADKNKTYMANIRGFLLSKGYDDAWGGSYEAGFINTLIKNGILGLIGFAIIYIWIIKKALSLNIRREKILIIGILIILLVSSLVESYVCNIHQIFGIFCYLTMTGLLYIGSQNQEDSL